MKKKNILLLTDDYLYLKHNSIIIKNVIEKNIVKNGKIANVEKFLISFTKFIKKNKLNNSLFGDNIVVIINNTWTNSDIYVFKYLFSNLNYRKIEFVYDYSYYNLKSNNAYLEIRDNYMIINYFNDYKKIETIMITNNMFNNLDDKMSYIANLINKRELYILGSGDEMHKFYNIFEDKYNIETYIYSNNETYILDNA